MESLRLDPEYLAKLAKLNPTPSGPPPTPKNVFELRATTEAIFGGLCLAVPFPEDVTETKFDIASYDGENITVNRFVLTDCATDGPQPTVIYIHGGGTVACNVNPIFRSTIAQYTSLSGVQCFAVEYRRPPENPHPAPTEDCYAALEWLVKEAHQLNVDPARIAVMGDSAGGGIAAGVALMSRDRKLSPPLAKQILLYPMLDDRTKLSPESDLNKFLIWTPIDNKLAWEAYVGSDAGNPEAAVSPYAAPARAESLSGLPPTYIDTGSQDLFRDEILAYTSRLAASNVQVEFHLHPGVPHGFDAGPDDIPVAQRAKGDRARAMRSF